MIERLVPGSASAEAFSEADGPLFASEAAAVASASAERRREFATGRSCARRALVELGESAVPVPRDTDGAPVWPQGIVGSITHCAGYRAAAVGRSGELAGIGIDAEPHAALPSEALDVVAGDAERARLRQLYDAEPNVHWDRVVFSVKEAVFKAWFPLTRRWLEFTDVSASLSRGGTFSARVHVKAPAAASVDVRSFAGRWTVAGGLILAATAVSR